MRHEHLQRRLRDWKGAARGVEKAVSDAELGKETLSRQIRLVKGRGQADVKELGHTLLEDSEFRLCSSCSGRGWKQTEPLHLGTKESTSYGIEIPGNVGSRYPT